MLACDRMGKIDCFDRETSGNELLKRSMDLWELEKAAHNRSEAIKRLDKAIC
jgi:hypothetical protein